MREAVAVASHSFPKNDTLRRELLARYPTSVFNESRAPLAGESLVRFLKGHDKAITGLERLDDDVFAAVPELRIVSKYGVGLDTIDREAAKRRGISIRWTPGVNKQAVAELTIAFMISLARNLMPLSGEIRDQIWTHGGGRQLSSSTVGIIGCGHVGRTVARLCGAFGAGVLAHDILDYGEFYRSNGITPVDLRALLRDSDFVTLHVPLDASTRGLIGAGELALMKPTAFLINTARGAIVDEAALKEALLARKLGGAAFDVFTIEPPVDTELLRLPNFVGTPHVGGSTNEAVLAMGRAAIEGLDNPAFEIA
ncbi:MAG TPA: phosphoglycerate dehydrogenase [Vicinamibacterales bacterium]